MEFYVADEKYEIKNLDNFTKTLKMDNKMLKWLKALLEEDIKFSESLKELHKKGFISFMREGKELTKRQIIREKNHIIKKNKELLDILNKI